MNTFDEIIEIAKAARDGKIIEVYHFVTDNWCDVRENEMFDFTSYTYRVSKKKKDPKKKKKMYGFFYVPNGKVALFDNQSINDPLFERAPWLDGEI